MKGILLTIMCALGIFLWGCSARINSSDLLGFSLPTSVSKIQIAQNTNARASVAYIRFEIGHDDVPVLLADSAFQPLQSSTDPFAMLDTAQLGDRSLAARASEQRPEWWNPPSGRPLTLANRSRPGPQIPYRGPDSAWYILDTHNPDHVTVYVVTVEL